MTTDQVLEEILPDRPFYDRSGGGVTLSGGEPVLQSGFARTLLEACKAERLHTAFETCGYCSWDALSSMLPVTDLVMLDIKHISPWRHSQATGRPNDRILENASNLANTNIPLIVRTPVVPSVNDTEEEIGEIAAFVRCLIDSRRLNSRNEHECEPIGYELLTFHRLGSRKYTSLGLGYDAAPLEPPSRDRMLELANAARRHGINPKVR
jgi:pyruvate formate lyase activating enzyme